MYSKYRHHTIYSSLTTIYYHMLSSSTMRRKYQTVELQYTLYNSTIGNDWLENQYWHRMTLHCQSIKELNCNTKEYKKDVDTKEKGE